MFSVFVDGGKWVIGIVSIFFLVNYYYCIENAQTS